MEPRLQDIEDYNGNESPKKRHIINLVVLWLFILTMVYAGFKIYYDNHMPAAFNPVVPQKDLHEKRVP